MPTPHLHRRSFATFAVALTVALQAGAAQDPQVDGGVAAAQPIDESPFPASTAIAEGVSPEALARLEALVRGFVDQGQVVGAELQVIVNGRSILHGAYGWRDRESETPMEPGSVFCVRSMTKPLIGTALWMLIGDDLVELDDPVSKYLPYFDAEGLRDVTIEHLMTHTGGFPYSLLVGRDLASLGDIQAVAALGADYTLDFEPGSAFQYSDQGTDTLTAVIEVASGGSAADFVRARILEPLGMEESTLLMTEGNALRARACSKYAGAPGEWKRFWSPQDPPLFPFFLGSQGLYATLDDYALFMQLWLDKGRAGRERLIRPAYVRKALRPGPFPLPAGTGLPGARVDYGHLMELWTRPEEGAAEGAAEAEREVVAFGHNGSDGTHAWVFPDSRAMVLYFTQSRGTMTGVQVEEALGELFLGAPFDPNQLAPPHDDYLGYYRENDEDLYRGIIEDGDELALEVLGRGVVALDYAGEDQWKIRMNPGTVLAFQRGEAGEVTGYAIGDHREYRFEPDADLPGAEEVVAKVLAAHRLDLLADLGPMRRTGTIEIASVNMEGELTTLTAWPDRFRVDSITGESFERVAFDGEVLRSETSATEFEVLEGERAAWARTDHLLAHFGDLSRWHSSLRVIQRLSDDGVDVLIVRAGDTSGPATTLYIEAETGLVRRVDSFALIPGMGRMGQSAEFGDFRDVSGMQLPFATKIELANPIIGEIRVVIGQTELGVDVPEGSFELK
ncbi:serine hydrolase domain-containing protein [Engelhardtia mirabilis]|uniref:Esterase EstB n=1 Tax=Engelhardtia mirabilis TaxID=2528011 RepID=A0A518BE15_9BACT|nr:Esterase EstB [Planctomycetes bacterium Pla133]QDU99550.1 Esterase EstB [Planctomycetes bacterium Pla86]